MPILCQYLLSVEGQRLLQDARVVELGAGVGVPGILAGRSCSELILTDWNPTVGIRCPWNPLALKFGFLL